MVISPLGRRVRDHSLLPMKLLDLAASHQTPLYVYDLDVVRRQARALREAIDFPSLRLLYAIKANPCPAVAQVLLDEDYGVDCVAPGEVALALRLGHKPSDILYTENNMNDEEMALAVKQGVLVNCGSLDRLEKLGRAGATTAAVRFNPDVGGGEHAHVFTAGPLTKFGVHHSQVSEVQRIEAETGIKVIGAHMHIGSNVLEAATFREAMGVILSVARELPHLEFIDFGGGLGVPYNENQAPLDLPTIGRSAGELMRAFCAEYGRDIELRLEPGRFLVAEAGKLLTTVTAVKTNPDGRTFVGCDSGFNHLIRPTMYGSYHPIANLSNPNGAVMTQDVVGNVCESGDIFARDRDLPQCRVGDVLAIGFAGAYGMSMASTYNLRPLPAEVVVSGETARCVRPRLSVDDLLNAWDWSAPHG